MSGFPTAAAAVQAIPANLRWSTAAAKKAAEKGTFIRVGGPKLTKRLLSGAERSWKSTDPSEYTTVFILHPEVRLSGPMEAVRMALSYHYPADAVAAWLATAVTRDNYQSSAAYAQELAALKALAGTKVKKAVADPMTVLNQAAWVAKNIKSADLVKKDGAASTKGSAAAGARGKSLAERVQLLGPGRVLDVSGLDASGKGARDVAMPGARSAKVRIGDLRIISDKRDGFVNALNILFPGQDINAYVAAFDAAMAGRVKAVAPAAAPAAPFPAAFAAPAALPMAVPLPAAPVVVAPAGARTPGRMSPTAVPLVASPGRRGLATVGAAGLPPLGPLRQ